jgi:hypothetical protein
MRLDSAVLALSEAAAAAAPTHRLGHAYFGPITLVQALGMLAAHTRHHTASIGARA